MYGTHRCVFTGILCVDANIELCTTYGEPVTLRYLNRIFFSVNKEYLFFWGGVRKKNNKGIPLLALLGNVLGQILIIPLLVVLIRIIPKNPLYYPNLLIRII